MRWVACLLAMLPQHLAACGCLVKLSLCQEVAASSAVFIGKVESVSPSYLDSANRRKAKEFRDEVSLLHQDPSAAALQRLKAVYSDMLGAALYRANAALEGAASMDELDGAFDKVLAQGEAVVLSIGRNFPTAAGGGQADDDAPSVNVNRKMVVWTGIDDCGVDFQSGETYLIYANSDEQTGRLETSACSRTRRLTDAAADLGYLFLPGQGKGKGVRLEGQLVPPPVTPASKDSGSSNRLAGMVVSVSGQEQYRYALSGPEGDFVFEGLPAGTYTISVYTADFPQRKVLVAEPVRITVSANTCSSPLVRLRPGWNAN